VTEAEPGRVLRRALVAWGLGHLAVGRVGAGRALLFAEAVAVALVAWLTAGLADSSLYLVPFLAGTAFIVAWAWQAVDAYRSARARLAAMPPAPERSPAAAIGWLSLPLLVWGTGFWLAGAHAATPAAVLDEFVTAWSDGELATLDLPGDLVAEAESAARGLGPDDPFRDVRVRIATLRDDRAIAVAESIHFERRPTRFLGVFPGSELVPVADDRILDLVLRAVPVELPGGGDIGAVRWELVEATAGR
jgi:hypothetical protein